MLGFNVTVGGSLGAVVGASQYIVRWGEGLEARAREAPASGEEGGE